MSKSHYHKPYFTLIFHFNVQRCHHYLREALMQSSDSVLQ